MVNRLVKDMEIYLKKKKTKGISMVASNLEDEKQRLVQYRKTCSKMQKIKLVDSFINDNRLLHKMKK